MDEWMKEYGCELGDMYRNWGLQEWIKEEGDELRNGVMNW